MSESKLDAGLSISDSRTWDEWSRLQCAIAEYRHGFWPGPRAATITMTYSLPVTFQQRCRIRLASWLMRLAEIVLP